MDTPGGRLSEAAGAEMAMSKTVERAVIRQVIIARSRVDDHGRNEPRSTRKPLNPWAAGHNERVIRNAALPVVARRKVRRFMG